MEQSTTISQNDSIVETQPESTALKWNLEQTTQILPSNAFGQIEFQGGPHPHKAKYFRLNSDTEPADIMKLFENIWKITPPSMIITIHGGKNDFELQPLLARAFRIGLLKATSTTGAWIITNGCDTGVVRHVAAALDEVERVHRNKIVCIGISPWGLLEKSEQFIGHDKKVTLYPSTSKNRFTVLNKRHSYFLLADDGTVGKHGADVVLRKRFEMYISQTQKIFGGTTNVPVVCVVLEGGRCTTQFVLDYVTSVPRVPVVVCDGSGRAADLISFAHQHVAHDGNFDDDVREQVLKLVKQTFECSETTANRFVNELTAVVQHKELLTIFRLGEKEERNFDHAILTALLKGRNYSLSDQLALAMAWDRVDIARSEVFSMGYEWLQTELHNAMLEALRHSRVNFVCLLLENGVNMKRFLTMSRLEDLYNSSEGPPNTLYYILRDVVKVKSGYRYRLPHIGLMVEKLIGNAYQSTYTTLEFREKYETRMNEMTTKKKTYRNRYSESVVCDSVNRLPISGNRALSHHILSRSAIRINHPANQMQSPNSRICHIELSRIGTSIDTEPDFQYPYSELLIWAVLTKRQNIAMCMWQYGEEALAKSLIACRLYESLAAEAAEDYLAVEVCEELKQYAEEFRVLSFDVLGFCYKRDPSQTLQLLTYELSNWSNKTCLALAVIVNHEQFLAHSCCQMLLADLWHGGLRIRRNSSYKVQVGLIPLLFLWTVEFKTREELLNQPQTAAEHEHDMNESHSNSPQPSNSSRSSNYSDDEQGCGLDERSRKPSQESVKRRRSNRVGESDTSAIEAGSNGANSELSTTIADRKELGMFEHQGTRPISVLRRCYEFYTAPIAVFWAWAWSYFIFIIGLAHVLLIRTPIEVSTLEWILFAYVVVFGMEHLRQMIMFDAKKITEKFKSFFDVFWNALPMAAVFFYIVGFIIRAFIDIPIGRVILGCDAILWIWKLFDFLSVHHEIGPYVTMAGRMISKMFYIIVMLVVALLAFGLARQSIMYTEENWDLSLVKKIFLKPYFMLYGEVYADEIDPCEEEVWDLENSDQPQSGRSSCVTGYWITPYLTMFFLLGANVLLMNMLIAIFNNIFDQTNKISEQIWLCERYRQVMEYNAKPFLPPPFTVLYYFYMLGKYMLYRMSEAKKMKLGRKHSLFDFSLKLFLNQDQIEKLHDFEEACMEDLARIKENTEEETKTCHTDTKLVGIFRQNEEYSSITDRIVIRQHKRRQRACLNSSDSSDSDENTIESPKKRSTKDARASTSRYIEIEEEKDGETNKSFDSKERCDKHHVINEMISPSSSPTNID